MPATNYLNCSHCGCEFLASNRQLKRSRSRSFSGRSVCSPACLAAAIGKANRRPYPYGGICPECGKSFGSRYPKEFCSQACYMHSDRFKNHLREAAKKGNAAMVFKHTGEAPRPPVEVECLNCGRKNLFAPSSHRKYCNTQCYRQYMAMRFDRWVASPQDISLPQNYDEFLLQNELPCLVDGCEWTGMALGHHVNAAHGITAQEFKRAVGFNLHTGLVTPDFYDKLVARPHIHEATFGGLTPEPGSVVPAIKSYISLESREHMAKSLALRLGAPPSLATRICRACGTEYRPKTNISFASLYCSVKCRSIFYRQKSKVFPLQCYACKLSFTGDRRQFTASSHGQPVVCSISCRQSINSRKRKSIIGKKPISSPLK